MMHFVCILILLLIGWASQPPFAMPWMSMSAAASSEASAGPDSEAYRLPDGTIPDICSDSGEHENASHGKASHDNTQHEKGRGDGHCDQCVAAGLVALVAPESDISLPQPLRIAGTPIIARPRLAELLSIDRATSRGPPVSP